GAERLRGPEPESKFDLTLYAAESSGEIELVAVYDSKRLTAPSMDALLGQLEEVLAQAVAHPDRRVDRFSLVTDDSRSALPDPRSPLPGVVDVHSPIETFVRRAAQHPSRVAVADAKRALTYGDLDADSNRLARHLLAHGIKAGDVVAVYAQRSAALALALLGVLKSHAAFLVLDPAY